VNLSDKVGNIKPKLVIEMEKYQQNGENFAAGKTAVKASASAKTSILENFELTWKGEQKRSVTGDGIFGSTFGSTKPKAAKVTKSAEHQAPWRLAGDVDEDDEEAQAGFFESDADLDSAIAASLVPFETEGAGASSSSSASGTKTDRRATHLAHRKKTAEAKSASKEDTEMAGMYGLLEKAASVRAEKSKKKEEVEDARRIDDREREDKWRASQTKNQTDLLGAILSLARGRFV
jgi:hypothetical protein